MAWEIDALHSQALFSVRQMARNTIQGRFSAVHGYLHVDGQNPPHSWIDLAIDAASVNTGDVTFDSRLRSKDMLDVAEYPTITFKSVRVSHVVSRDYQVTGELTIHGVTKLVTFDVGFEESRDVSDGSRLAVLTARTHINGRDYGVRDVVFPAARWPGMAEAISIEIMLALVSHES